MFKEKGGVNMKITKNSIKKNPKHNQNILKINI